ncbi:hypothetical protein PR048_013997, partial [Dryococelus australis]
MDKAIIATMKQLYRGITGFKAFWKQLTVLDAIYDVSKAWHMIKPITLSKSSKKIFPDIEAEDCFGFENDKFSATNLSAALRVTAGCENVDSMAIKEWFEVDRMEPGHEVVSDCDIVKRVKGQVETDDSDEDEALIPEKHIS